MLIVAQLALFAITIWVGGISLVAEGTGLDDFTPAQMSIVATLVISGVGWMFFANRAHKLLN